MKHFKSHIPQNAEEAGEITTKANMLLISNLNADAEEALSSKDNNISEKENSVMENVETKTENKFNCKFSISNQNTKRCCSW